MIFELHPEKGQTTIWWETCSKDPEKAFSFVTGNSETFKLGSLLKWKVS